MTEAPFRCSRRAVLVAGLALAAGARTATAQTPVPVDPFAARLGSLLAALPADGETGAETPVYYADLAAQLDALGIPRPPVDATAALPAGFPEATMGLPLAARAFQAGLDPAWMETFGFSPFAVDRALELAAPPHILSVFAGGFRRERVEAALEGSGYTEMLQEAGGSYWMLGDDLDLETAAGRLGVGTMNHAIVHDDLLVFGQDEGDIQRVTWTRAGLEPPLSEQEPWPAVLAAFPRDTVGLMVVPPRALAPVPAGQPGATPGAAPPVIDWLAFGVRAGGRAAPLSLVGEGTPAATPVGAAQAVPTVVEARIAYLDASDAEREAGEIPDRWASAVSLRTGEPLAEVLALEQAAVMAADPHVVALTFLAEQPNSWLQLIHAGDLAPLAPPAG